MTVPGRLLLTGGARSGKSTLAEALLAGSPTTYVATGPDGEGDPEWRERVAAHRSRRPPHWTTVETADVAPVVAAADPQRPVLVDCLTLWLTARMDRHDAWQRPGPAARSVLADVTELVAAVRDCAGGLVLVTNEVGSGIVPADPGTRLFRDLLGTTNSAVAAACDEVRLVVAGHSLTLQRDVP